MLAATIKPIRPLRIGGRSSDPVAGLEPAWTTPVGGLAHHERAAFTRDVTRCDRLQGRPWRRRLGMEHEHEDHHGDDPVHGGESHGKTWDRWGRDGRRGRRVRGTHRAGTVSPA